MSYPVLSDLDFGNAARVVNLLDPTLAQHPATKAYTDAAISNAISLLAWKDAVKAASSGSNIVLSAPGATLDGVTLAVNDRFLAKDQTVASENGIYVFNGASSAATRSADFSTQSEIEGARVPVEKGTSNTATLWVLTTQGPTIGSALAFTNQNAAAPSASTTTDGLARLATQIQVDSGVASPTNLVVTPATLAAYAGGKKKYAGLIGDGVATSIVVSHALGTLDIQVAVYRVSDGQQVMVDTKYTSATSTTFTFAAAPASNALRVVILG